MIITLKDFFQFLIDNKALHPYMKYLKTNNKWRRQYYLDEKASSYLTSAITNEYMVNRLILYAFEWGKTYEGYAFWEKMSNLWREHVSNLQCANMYKLAQQLKKEKVCVKF